MRRTRPDRDELFEAAVELVSTGSSGFKSTARRYSLCPADADDAYQRGLEILITKAPTEEREQLRPWLHTVIKHEALAIRRQRERMLGGGQPSALEATAPEDEASPEDRAPERERAHRTAEALSQLKPSEVQCLLLKALGYSYDEISVRTGFSWTKVNRSLTEGRKRFHDRFAQIESGRRCRRFASLLSAASDGEAAPDDERLLKTHLRACPGCRATLRDYRTLPARLTELLPPAVLLPALQKESWWSRLYDTIGLWTADRSGALGHKIQQVGETLSAQKATAVVASTAALTGGTLVGERVSHDRGSHRPEHAGRPHEDSGRAGATAALAASAALSSPATSSRPQSPEPERGTPIASAAGEEFAPGPANRGPAPGGQPAHAAGMPSVSGPRGLSAPETRGGPDATSAGAKAGRQPGTGQEFAP
jgi:RNA polymerase sigma factor (sigma-70 family)